LPPRFFGAVLFFLGLDKLTLVNMYYTKDTILFFNGKFQKAMEAGIDLYSQSLHYGFGVFEGLRSYQTQHGVKIFKAQEHFDRLKEGCKIMGMALPYNTEELIQSAYQVLQKNHLTDAYIRPLAFAGPNMELTIPKEVHLVIFAWKWGKYHGENLLKLGISSFQRPNSGGLHTDAKISGQYVNSILATSEARSRGYDEALMLDMNGDIASAPGANIFMEKEGVLFTPQKGYILPGITRKTVISICKELDIPVVEKSIKPEELESADSAFLCGTATDIAGIESINAKGFKKNWNQSLGSTIQEAYRCQVLEKSFSYVII